MADTAQNHRSTSPATDKSHEESTNESTEQIKEAIVNDNLAAVERILDTSLDVLETVFDYTLPGDENIIKGLTPLMLAAALGRLEITKLLLEKGSDCFAITDEVVNLLSCGKQNAFFFAISRNKFEVAKVILQKGGTRLLESRNERGETPLIVAARNGTVNVIDFLIEKGADIKARMGDGKTATHVASAFGHFAVVEKIYKAGGTGILEDRGRLDETPLLVAAACGDIEIFRFLLDKGASTMAQDTGSHTALHYASRASSFDIVKLLLEKEPDLLDMRTKYAETALLLAAEKGDLKIVEFLLDKGADIMARDYSKNTALHIASRESYIDIAKVLIKKEPDLLDARNGNEDTALLIAAFCADLEVVKFLHGKGADIEAEDWTGNTPLLHASYSRDRSVIRYLSKAGADPSKTTKSGPNALHIACYHQDAEVVDILLESPANILKTIIAAKILRLLESKVYLPESPAQDDVYVASSSETDRVLEWLLKWVNQLPDKNEYDQEKVGEGSDPIQDERGQETSNIRGSFEANHHINAVIYWAFLNGKGHLLELVMKKSQMSSPSQEGNRKGVTWLHVAALGGHVALLEHLPDWRDHLSAEATKKITPLHLAAKQGNYDMVWKFLECLESESLDNNESTTTGRLRVLRAIVQRTEEEETSISLAAARKDSRDHVRVERSLWDKLFQIIEGDTNFLESPHSDEAELVMGLAAWRHTTGEKEYFDKFMGHVHRRLQCKHFHQSPLQLTVCHKFPVALWWLLSSGGYSGENHIREGEAMMKNWGSPKSSKENLIHGLIEELIKNPRPVRPPLKNDRRPPRFQFQRPESELQKGTMLNLSITDKGGIIFKLKRASMVDIIYDKGPEEIMRTEGYSSFQAFREKLLSIREDSYDPQSKAGEAAEEKPRDVVTGWEGNIKKKPEKGATSEPTSRERKSRFRWIHIPVNNLRYVEELMVRISQEKKRDNGYHRQLADFMQKSRSELPAGGRNHYMKPDCQSNIIAQDVLAGSDTMKSKTNPSTKNTKVLALYMPYLGWGQEPGENNIEDSNKETLLSKTSQQWYRNGSQEQIISDKNQTDGGTDLRPISPDLNKLTKAPTFDLCTFTAPIHGTASSAALIDTTEGRKLYTTNDRPTSTKNCVHDSITLDQYYYVSLHDTESRDHDQVLVRFFDRLRKRFRGDKEKADGDKRGNTKVKRREQNSMQIHGSQLDTHGEGLPNAKTMFNIKPTQILMVNQLWLWILDSDTIITSTTEEPDDVTNTFLQRVLNNLQAQNGKTVSSIEDIAEYIIATATSLFNAQDIEIDDSDDGKRSPLEIFRETIQHVRDEETRLFREFRLSLTSVKQDKSSTKNKTSRTHSRPEKWWRHLAPENPYEDISMETRLLDEVKDILDELNILKNLALDQKTVYESWKSVSGMEDYHHITPSEVKEDIEGMIEDSKSVQSAINTLLDLKQKEATILEAQATRRQSDAVMVFTVVTIIFLPASFLTSMFALNITNVPHEDGNLIYQGRWIFPIIFGISVPVSIVFMIIAFNANKIKSIWRAWTENRNHKPQKTKSKNQAEEGIRRRRMMGPGNDGNV